MNAPKTKRGCERQYQATLRAYEIAFQGGGSFGWDFHTLRLNDPATYERLRYLHDIYPSLPE